MISIQNQKKGTKKKTRTVEVQNDPTAHKAQTEAPSEFEKAPIGQSLGFDNPDILQNVPSGHLLQFTMPKVAAYVPTGHNTLLGINVPLAVNAL